eukprot:5880285-Prymnesium_polylepis.1
MDTGPFSRHLLRAYYSISKYRLTCACGGCPAACRNLASISAPMSKVASLRNLTRFVMRDLHAVDIVRATVGTQNLPCGGRLVCVSKPAAFYAPFA